MIQELATRFLVAENASVVWFMDCGVHCVQVRDAGDELVSLRSYDRGSAAREAFEHPALQLTRDECEAIGLR